MKCKLLALALLSPIVFTGCPRDNTDDSLTLAEANQALDESTIDSQGQGLASDNIELSTTFTLGQALQAAAQQVSDFITSQIPCASVALANDTLTVNYSANGSCSYHGHVITGTSEITITKDDTGDVIVDHTWTALSNGLVQVDGTATVTWSGTAQSRHVEHNIVIMRLRDGKTVDSTGDRTQTPLNGDLTVGIAVNGTRSWTSTTGTWDLTIDNVQMQWVDPVPQAGSYSLVTPKNKTLTLSFQRKDSDTITVTLAGNKRSFSFDVTSTGDATAN